MLMRIITGVQIPLEIMKEVLKMPYKDLSKNRGS